MPRKPLEDPPRKVTLNVPSSVMVQLELRLYDPMSGMTRYGALSNLITALLRNWITEQNNNNVVNTPLTTSLTKESVDGNNDTGTSE